MDDKNWVIVKPLRPLSVIKKKHLWRVRLLAFLGRFDSWKKNPMGPTTQQNYLEPPSPMPCWMPWLINEVSIQFDDAISWNAPKG